MKNIETDNALSQKCIYMTADRFAALFYKLTSSNLDICPDCGIFLDAEELEDGYDGDQELFMDDLKFVLSRRYDVEVISIHTDNNKENLGVWIVYEDKE